VKGSCEHSDEPSGSIKCWEVLEYFDGFSRRAQLHKRGDLNIRTLLVSKKMYLKK
jgi:hypothetical protein